MTHEGVGDTRLSKRPRTALPRTSLFLAVAVSLTALLLVSDQRAHWLAIGSEADSGYGYGYEPGAVDAAADVIVDGATVSRAGRKAFAVAISNSSTDAISVDPSQDIVVTVTVNGIQTGSISTTSGEVTISPGDSERFVFQWLYADAVSRGDTVVYSACVNVSGDVDDADDCDSETATAR
jgi:hypothetical protein